LDNVRFGDGEIFGFERVALIIVKLELRRTGRRAGFLPFDEAITFGADGAAQYRAVTPSIARKDVKNRVLGFCRGLPKNRDKTLAFERLRVVWRGQACELAKGRVEVYCFHQRAAARA
jgi:hypothetical protein